MAARDADGGMIKPNNINCSGTAYIRQWQKAWAERVGWGDSPYRPSRVTIWEKEPYEVPDGVPLRMAQLPDITKHSARWHRFDQERPKIHAAFHAINWQPYFGSTSRRADITERAAFLNALFLYTNRKGFPFTINLS